MAWPEGASSLPLLVHCLWRRRHSTTSNNSQAAGPGKRSVAGRLPAAPPSALNPQNSQEAKSEVCVQDRSQVICAGEEPGPSLRCGNLRQARRRSPRPRVTSRSQPRPPLRDPRRHAAASCLGPFRVGGTGAIRDFRPPRPQWEIKSFSSQPPEERNGIRALLYLENNIYF